MSIKQVLFPTPSTAWGRNRQIKTSGLVLGVATLSGFGPEIVISPIAKSTDALSTSVEIRIPIKAVVRMRKLLTHTNEDIRKYIEKLHADPQRN